MANIKVVLRKEDGAGGYDVLLVSSDQSMVKCGDKDLETKLSDINTDIQGLQTGLTELSILLNDKADDSVTRPETIYSGGWGDGGLNADEYNMNIPERLSTDIVVEIFPRVGITDEQLKAYQLANIQDNGQSWNNIQLKAFGEVPTINIPVQIVVRGDL